MTPYDWHKGPFERLLSAGATLPHALLLRGARGIGKLAFARALAQALLCEAPRADGYACGRCSACQWFDSGTHPDFRQIEPSAEDPGGEEEEGGRRSAAKKSAWIRVEDIRALADLINMTSHRGGAKTIVIHPAEALYTSAANALLKSLEEPPPRTFFILVTHRPHQLLPTIKSRCQQVALDTPDAKSAAAWLAAQGVRDAHLALAHMGGAPLLAAELADSGYWGARAAFLRQLCAPELDVLAAADAVQDCPIPHVIAWLQKWTYDLVHYRTLGRVRYNPDHENTIARAAAAADPVEAMRFHREMVKLQRYAQHPLNARLFIEQVLLDYRDAVEPQNAIA